MEPVLPLLYVRVFFLKEILRIGVIMSSFPIVSSHLQWLSTDSLSVKYVWVKFVERAFAKVGRVSCLICEKKFLVDPGRIRTCNPLIRSQMPYPLGHRASCQKLFQYGQVVNVSADIEMCAYLQTGRWSRHSKTCTGSLV